MKNLFIKLLVILILTSTAHGAEISFNKLSDQARLLNFVKTESAKNTETAMLAILTPGRQIGSCKILSIESHATMVVKFQYQNKEYISELATKDLQPTVYKKGLLTLGYLGHEYNTSRWGFEVILNPSENITELSFIVGYNRPHQINCIANTNDDLGVD